MNGQDWLRSNKPLLSIFFGAELAYLFTLLVWVTPGIGYVLFTASALASLGVFGLLFGKKFPSETLVLASLAIFFAGMIAIRANLLLTILNIVGTMLLVLLISEVQIQGSMREFTPMDFLKVFALPFSYISAFSSTIGSVRFPYFGNLSSKQKEIIRGTIITVPVIFILAVLFAGADPVFNSALTSILNVRLSFPDHPYVLIGSFVIFYGILVYSVSEAPTIKSEAKTPARRMGYIETSILLGSVNVLFLTFILLQATYFFGGVVNITNHAFTYAEYARRGFFELITIAFLTYIILLAVEKLIERTENHSKQFRYLSIILVVQVMALMIFAFNRLSLYESVFGFTTLRLYSHAFIILLAVVYVFLLAKILMNFREARFSLLTFWAIVAFVAGMNLLNPDQFIAQKNLERFHAIGKIDYFYNAGLSSDATPVLMKMFTEGDPLARTPLGWALYQRVADAPEDSWQSWNKSRSIELTILRSRVRDLDIYRR